MPPQTADWEISPLRSVPNFEGKGACFEAWIGGFDEEGIIVGFHG
jgi:hypothetical protein